MLNYKKFLPFITIFGLSIGLGACEKVELAGTAQVTKAFAAKEKAGSSKTVNIPAGSYNAAVTMSRTRSEFTLTSNSGAIAFSAKTPKSARDGIWQDFSFAASELKQNFSLVGKNNVKTTRGALYEKSDSCVYDSIQRERCTPGYWTEGRHQCYPGRSHCTPDRRECHKVRDGSDDGYRCEWEVIPGHCTNEPGYCETTPPQWIPERCHTETDYIYGTQDKSGRDVTTQNILSVGIFGLAQERLGSLSFKDNAVTNFVAERTGPCVR